MTEDCHGDLADAVINHSMDGKSVSLQPDPDGVSGALALATNAATAESEQTLTVKGQNGDASKASAGVLKMKVSTTALKTLFVDPATGKDANPGTQSKPFKTLTKALSKAKAGDTVRLAGGVYSKATNGEAFSAAGLPVPARVTLDGTSFFFGIGTRLEGPRARPGSSSRATRSRRRSPSRASARRSAPPRVGRHSASWP